MNERIRLLAEQAGLRFTQLMSNPMVPVVDGRETDLEKFAQLIVAECAQIAKDSQDFYNEHNSGVVNHEIFTMIKLRFGVE
jgi:hypothetical protein|tara:strand:- start:96 stop:338 length:243 start_codon:yes stop_codon:yes gene_type:complete